MKKLLVVLCGVLLSAFVVTGIAQAADKFGFINLARAFSEYSKTKEFDKALTGSMLPLLLKRLGLDPAVSSAPFVASRFSNFVYRRLS